MVTIVQKGDKILRSHAHRVPLGEIKSPKIKKVIAKMRAGIASRDDAVAIAAQQVGHLLRMFMVSKKVFLSEGENDEQVKNANDAVFINPVIVKISRKKMDADEGCLSVDTWYGKTKRATKVTIRAYNENGEPIERGASGLLAQIFQHEIDHLEGILFTDHAKDLFKLSPNTEPKKNTPPQ